jgi:hypothetical protein
LLREAVGYFGKEWPQIAIRLGVEGKKFIRIIENHIFVRFYGNHLEEVI